MPNQKLIQEFQAAIASNRRSAEVEGIIVDPRIEALSNRQFLGEITGLQARQEACRLLGINPDLVR